MMPVAKKRQGGVPAKTPTKKVKKENGAHSAEKEAWVDKGLLLQYANKVLDKFDEIAEWASLADWLLCTRSGPRWPGATITTLPTRRPEA